MALEEFSAGPPRNPLDGYGDPALQEVLPPNDQTTTISPAFSDDQLDFSFLRELSAEEYDQPEPRESRVLPRRNSSNRWKTRLAVLFIAAAAILGLLFVLLRDSS
jgi:hypothetical protein